MSRKSSWLLREERNDAAFCNVRHEVAFTGVAFTQVKASLKCGVKSSVFWNRCFPYELFAIGINDYYHVEWFVTIGNGRRKMGGRGSRSNVGDRKSVV